MRRAEREVKDCNEQLLFLQKENVLRLGLTDDEGVYIVPINYGVEKQGDTFTFYMHGAKEGRKAGIISKEPSNVSFEIDGMHAPDIKTGCDSTFNYMSAIGTGSISVIDDKSLMVAALDVLMKQLSGTEGPFEYKDGVLNNTLVFKLEVKEVSFKKN